MPPCCGGAPGSDTLLAAVCIEESLALVADQDVEESAFEPRSCLQPSGGRQSYRAGNTNVDGDVEVVEFEIDFNRTDVDLNPHLAADHAEAKALPSMRMFVWEDEKDGPVVLGTVRMTAG